MFFTSLSHASPDASAGFSEEPQLKVANAFVTHPIFNIAASSSSPVVLNSSSAICVGIRKSGFPARRDSPTPTVHSKRTVENFVKIPPRRQNWSTSVIGFNREAIPVRLWSFSLRPFPRVIQRLVQVFTNLFPLYSTSTRPSLSMSKKSLQSIEFGQFRSSHVRSNA
jgi:hypothetical protein